MLFEVVQAYWSELEAFNRLSSRIGGILDYRMPSYGWAISSESVEELWGQPFRSCFRSRQVDIQNDLRLIRSRSGDEAPERGYLMNTGIISSYMEGMILDQLFSERLGEGISAVRILELANLQSVPIYSVSKETLPIFLTSAADIDENVLSDISSAVSSGYVAVVPKTRIAHSGWIGSGYILTDPASGAGRYMISGSLSGGSALTADTMAMPIPDIPITGAAALVIDNLMNGAGAFIAQNVVGSGDYATASMMCIAIPAGATLEGAIVAAMFVVIFLLLADLIKTIVEKFKPPQVYKTLRQYTRFNRAERIWNIFPRFLLMSDWFGDLLLPGVYLTDIFQEPMSLLTSA